MSWPTASEWGLIAVTFMASFVVIFALWLLIDAAYQRSRNR